MKVYINYISLFLVFFLCLPEIHAQKSIDNIFLKSALKTITQNQQIIVKKPKHYRMSIDLDDYGVYDLYLEKTSLVTKSYIERRAQNNKKTKLPMTFTGSIKGQSNSKVSLTSNDNYLSGFIDTGKEVIYFEPYRNFNRDAVENEIIIYYQKDIIDRAHTCTTKHTELQKEQLESRTDEFKSLATGCFEVELLMVADYGMYQKHGVNTESHLTAVVNNLRNKYDNEFNDPISFMVTDFYIATSPSMNKWSNTTDASSLLEEFKNSDFSDLTNVGYDLASLWVTRDIVDMTSATVGLAYNPGTCSSFRYNLIQDFSTTAELGVLFAHEIGHNFGATHDPNNNSTATIMEQGEFNTSTWSHQSQNQINAFYPTATCLCVEDDFVDLTLDFCGSWILEDNIITVANVQIKNIGTIANSTTEIGWYLSTDSNITSSDHLLFSGQIPPINPGNGYVLGFTSSLFNVPPGNYHYGVFIDYNENLIEFNEDNNIACVSPTPNITAPSTVCATGGEPPVITGFGPVPNACGPGNIGFELTFENLNSGFKYDVFYTSDFITWSTAGATGIQFPETTTGSWTDCDYLNKDALSYRLYGTCDSDNDGLTDAFEILSTGTDPNDPDSDNNGIIDSEEDADCDGYTNLSEYTNPHMATESFCDNTCEDDIFITENPSLEIYSGNQYVHTVGYVTVSNRNLFRAGGAVELNPGFVAEPGSVFVGEIGPCIPVDANASSSLQDENKPIENDLSLSPRITPSETLIESNYIKNYPNPFSGQTTFEIYLAKDAIVNLRFTDLAGNQIQSVMKNTLVKKGLHTINIDAGTLAAGTYMYTIQAGNFIESKLMTVIH